MSILALHTTMALIVQTRHPRRECPPVYPETDRGPRQDSIEQLGKIPVAMPLDLLGAPALVGFPHVGGRLDGRDELEDDVDDAGEADDGAGDDGQGVLAQDDGTDEEVDCARGGVSSTCFFSGWRASPSPKAPGGDCAGGLGEGRPLKRVAGGKTYRCRGR